MAINDENPKTTVEGEKNYDANKKDPNPAPEAIREEDDKPAGQNIKVVIGIAIALLIIFFIIFYFI